MALTRTAAKADELRALGAIHVIATTEQDLVAEVRRITDSKGASLIFESVAGQDFGRCAEAAARDGLLIV